jgi:hypothetical protein
VRFSTLRRPRIKEEETQRPLQAIALASRKLRSITIPDGRQAEKEATLKREERRFEASAQPVSSEGETGY